jgi:hypothetical protein
LAILTASCATSSIVVCGESAATRSTKPEGYLRGNQSSQFDGQQLHAFTSSSTRQAAVDSSRVQLIDSSRRRDRLL